MGGKNKTENSPPCRSFFEFWFPGSHSICYFLFFQSEGSCSYILPKVLIVFRGTYTVIHICFILTYSRSPPLYFKRIISAIYCLESRLQRRPALNVGDILTEILMLIQVWSDDNLVEMVGSSFILDIFLRQNQQDFLTNWCSIWEEALKNYKKLSLLAQMPCSRPKNTTKKPWRNSG